LMCATTAAANAKDCVQPGNSTGNDSSCLIMPPEVSATPELDSVLLFGAGGLGMAGYALTRIRAARRP
jgi:hypothetical protein